MTTAHELARQGLSQREIADRLDIAQSTVHYRLKTVESESEHGHRWDAHLESGGWYYECQREGCGMVVDGPATTEVLTSDCEAKAREAA